jgi:hypothetical protein
MEKSEALLVESDIQTLMEILFTCFRMKWNICVGGCGGGNLKQGNNLANVSVTGWMLRK